MRLLYAGFDTVDVAVRGALSPPSIVLLQKAKEESNRVQTPVFIQLGPGECPLHVHGSGMQGGYSVRTDTGPLGEIISFKVNPSPAEWNIFVSLRASSLAAYGYEIALSRMWDRLQALGATITGHSVNRMDYAMDFLAPGFALRLDGFVAHPRTKVHPYWSGTQDPASRDQPAAVCRGRRLESVRVGTMPGRQVVIYDKWRASIEQRKLFWFEVWGLDPKEGRQDVWRVEIRAGKKELKNRYSIRTISDANDCIGDVLINSAKEVRYTAPMQTDTNVSRHELDPIWAAAMRHMRGSLNHRRAGLLPGRVIEIERRVALDTYRALFLGNLAGYAVASGMDEETIEISLADVAHDLVNEALNTPERRFATSISKCRDRLFFISPSDTGER